MKTVIVFGDSLAFGRGDEKSLGGWVGRIKPLIENKEGYWCLYNLGIPGGEKTEDVLKRFIIEVEARHKPNFEDKELFLIFAIGVNDTRIINGKPITNKRRFKGSLETLINLAKDYCKNIVFLGLLPVDEAKIRKTFGSKAFQNKAIDEFNNLINKTCKRLGVLFFDMGQKFKNNSAYLNTLTGDGLHPDSSGYELIANETRELLKVFFK